MKSFFFLAIILLLTAPTLASSNNGKHYRNGAVYGYESIEQYGFIPGNSGVIVEARCTEGKKVLGGGYTLLSGGDWGLISLGPSPDGEGYYLEMGSKGEEPQEVLVTAICASVSSTMP
jgi:hypothetical protein